MTKKLDTLGFVRYIKYPAVAATYAIGELLGEGLDDHMLKHVTGTNVIRPVGRCTEDVIIVNANDLVEVAQGTSYFLNSTTNPVTDAYVGSICATELAATEPTAGISFTSETVLGKVIRVDSVEGVAVDIDPRTYESLVSTTFAGLMSPTDKTKLDNAPANVTTTISTLSGSIATTINILTASVNTLSSSIASTINHLTSSVNAMSGTIVVDFNTVNNSIAAITASQDLLSGSVATTINILTSSVNLSSGTIAADITRLTNNFANTIFPRSSGSIQLDGTTPVQYLDAAIQVGERVSTYYTILSGTTSDFTCDILVGVGLNLTGSSDNKSTLFVQIG